MSFRYLLGDSAPEAERLEAQAALWDPVSCALFDRVGVAAGWRILEIGPGAGSLHFELRRRAAGPVDAVEQSASFCSSLMDNARRDGFGEGHIWNEKLLDAALPAEHYDFIFARWVFLFLPNPEAHLLKLVAAMKPGGIIALQDYFRDSMCLIPRPAEWDLFMAADRAFFALEGGDANIGTRLPALYRNAGLELLDVAAAIKNGHPGSPVWSWISTYFFGIQTQLSAIPPLTPETTRRLFATWQDAEAHPASLLISPTLLDVVGRRRRL
jgi:SAM-dependent methyltransferase